MCPSFLKQKLLLDISTVESTEKWNESTDILAGILTGYVDLGFVVFFCWGGAADYHVLSDYKHYNVQ